MDRLNQSLPRGRPVSTVEAAKANDALEHFISSATLKTILGNYRHICELLHLKPNVFPLFYPKLKANINSWKAKALWKKFDARASHKCYARGKACPNTRVLIIGAGPCGLRTAIEAQLLGAKVVVIEKRDRMSRNNVLHLWPFVIDDLRALGAKKFFGKFCAGAIDHISIRQLQCILLKVALLLGVEVHTEVSFEKIIEPNSTEKIGWRAEFKPADHPVSQYEFDVIIGADGKRNTLQGFRRKEFRGKLAIAITANFINKRTEAEARVEEISGVAFIFNQKFFKELNAETGIDLENIVYYKDDTHYFVMTAKKLSLIDKGVIKQDYADTARLLSPDNVDRDNLMEYAREAAEFSTNYQMPDLEFAVNHYGQPDVAMFDFTSMYAAENASKVIERHGYKLLMTLVGDSLLEPFWPTGSGCARGFLSSLDACWAIKAWGSGLTTPLEVLAERESIYRLLAQTTPENLNKDCKSYTLDPSTRYPNLNRATLVPQQVLSLYDSDDPSTIELTSRIPQPAVTTESHRKRRRRDVHLDPNTLLSWIKEQVREYEDLKVEDVTASFRDGRVLCAILHHYRPDLVDYSAIKPEDVAKNNQLAFDLLEKEIGISPVMTGEDMAKAEVPDYLTMFSYLTQIYDTFRVEIPHIKHPKLNTLSFKPTLPRIQISTEPSEAARYRSKRFVFKSRQEIAKSKAGMLITNLKASKKGLTVTKTSSVELLGEKSPLKVEAIDESERAKGILGKGSTHLEEVYSQPDGLTCALNFAPLKSLEEKEEQYPCRKHSYSSKYSCSDVVQHSSNIEMFTAINKCSINEHSRTVTKMRCYDEHFQEICSTEISFQTDKWSSYDKISASPVTSRITNTLIKDVKHSSGTSPSANTSQPSEIILKHVEEDFHTVSYQELQLHSCPNSLTIKIKQPVRKRLKRARFNRVASVFRKNTLTACHSQQNMCQVFDANSFKFLYKGNMSSTNVVVPEVAYDRIVNWINVSDFKEQDGLSELQADMLERLTDISSVTKNIVHDVNREIKVEKRSQEVKCVGDPSCSVEAQSVSLDSMTQLVEKLKSRDLTKFPRATSWSKLQSAVSEFPIINEETELPDTKENLKELPRVVAAPSVRSNNTTAALLSRFTPSRPKRHAEALSLNKPAAALERKNKKRKSFEKYEMSLNRKNMLTALWETIIICLVLFILDFIINHEEYM